MEVARQWYCKKVITTLLFAPEIKKKERYELCNIYYSLLTQKGTLLNLL